MHRLRLLYCLFLCWSINSPERRFKDYIGEEAAFETPTAALYERSTAGNWQLASILVFILVDIMFIELQDRGYQAPLAFVDELSSNDITRFARNWFLENTK